MKTKITKKDAYGWNGTLQVGYCDLYYLLHYTNAYGYNCGVYGWNFDHYCINGIGINTGYRGMVGKKVDYDLTRLYNEKARKIVNNNNLSYNQKKYFVNKLLNNYLEKAIKKGA